jgi:hypothetical protein
MTIGHGQGPGSPPASIVGVERAIASSDCSVCAFTGYGKIDPVVSSTKLAARLP